MNCEQCKWRNVNPEVCKTCKQDEVEKTKVTMLKGYNKVSLKN